MLDLGFDVDNRNEKGQTPLAAAAANGYHDKVKLLIEYNADVNRWGWFSESGLSVIEWSALHVAAFYSHIPVVDVLLKAHADANIMEYSGWTPLMVAAREGHMGLANKLIRNNALLNVVNGKGRTALHVAAYNDCLMTKILLEACADINVTDARGYTLLMLAAHKGYNEAATSTEQCISQDN